MKKRLKKYVIVSLLTFGMVVSNGTLVSASVPSNFDGNVGVASFDSTSFNYLNEEVRVIVELDEKSVSDDNDNFSDFTDNLQKEEDSIIASQSSIINEVEKITGNKVVNRCGYLLNLFSVDAKRSDIEKIRQISGVCSVEEAPVFEIPKYDENKIENINEVVDEIKQEKQSFDGESMVVAVIDSAFNINHPDMKLDDGVKTKFSKDEWDEKIEDLGYGSYLSDKFPFGYNYFADDTNLSGDPHGSHVSGIIAANGKIKGVCPNAQIVGMKVFDDEDANASCDDIFRAFEDAVKLDVDVINLSIGGPVSINAQNFAFEQLIQKAHKAGIVVCFSAGNEYNYGHDLFGFGSVNVLRQNDVSAINNWSLYDSCFCVASAFVPSISYVDESLYEYSPYDPHYIRMSEFSSWGCDVDLKIKPEITACGHDVTSTVDGDNYEVYSGTSMSSPYIAGASVNVLSYLNSKSISDKNISKDQLVKNMLMNTADIIYDKYNYKDERNIPYPVRQQGAGLVNIQKALSNYVTATYNDKAKVELGEINNDKIDFSIALNNYGDEDATYKLGELPLYHCIIDDDWQYFSAPIDDAFLKFDKDSVTVKAHDSEKINVTMTLPKDLDKNQFVEGFVQIEGVDVCDLSLPILGFFGDWDSEPIFGQSIYDYKEPEVKNYYSYGKHKNSYEGRSFIIGDDGVLGKYNDASLVAFSPNGDKNQDEIGICIARFRDAKEVKVKVLDENNNELRTLYTYGSMGRTAMDSEDITDYGGEYCIWDGTIYDTDKNEYFLAKDGIYTIKVEGKVREDSKVQSFSMPVKIDNQKPHAQSSIEYDENGDKLLILEVEDNVGLASYFEIGTTDDYIEIDYDDLDKKDGKYVYNLTKNKLDNKTFVVKVNDAALNNVVLRENISEDDNEIIDIDKKYYIPRSDAKIQDLSIEFDNDKLQQKNDYTKYLTSTYYLSEGENHGVKIRFKLDGVDENTKLWLKKYEVGNYDPLFNDEYIKNKEQEEDDNPIIYFDHDWLNGGDDSWYYNDIDWDNIDFDEWLEKMKEEWGFNDYEDDVWYPDATSIKTCGVKKDIDYRRALGIYEGPSSIGFRAKYYIDGIFDDDAYYNDVYNFTKLDIELEEDGYYSFYIDIIDDNYIYDLSIFNSDYSESFLKELYFSYDNNTIEKFVNEYMNRYDNFYFNFIENNFNRTRFDGSYVCAIKNELIQDSYYTLKGQLDSFVKSLTIDGTEIKLGDNNTYETKIKLDKPIKKVFFEIENNLGKKITRGLTFFKDDIQLDLDLPAQDEEGVINTQDKEFTIKGCVKDYLNAYGLKINGNSVKEVDDKEVSSQNGTLYSHDFEEKVSLQSGINTFIIEVKDKCGNKVTKTVKVKLVENI